MARGVLLLCCLAPCVLAALTPTAYPSDLQYLRRGEDDGFDGPLRQDYGDAVGDDKDARECTDGVLACVRKDIAVDLKAILSADEGFNVTPSLVVERIGAQSRAPPPSLSQAGLPTLAATAIKLFQTHALVWRLWPGVMHLKVYNHPGEGMDAAVEIQPALAARTWGAIAARRRITMALLPIMYKMGVGTTLLGVLTFIAVKTMFMVSILFVLAVSSFFKHKLASLATPVAYVPHPHPPHKEVHLHVHTDPNRQHAPAPWHHHGSPYGDDGYHQGPGYQHGYQGFRPSAYSTGGDDAGYYHESEQPVYYRRGPPGSYITSRWDIPASGATGGAGYYT